MMRALRARWTTGLLISGALCAACDGTSGPGLLGGSTSGQTTAGPTEPPCAPITCQSASVGCGIIDDGCGGLVSCGTCVAPRTCGGAGVEGQCGCTPVTCMDAGVECGAVPDGCGDILECGACPEGKFCGGAGPSKCGDVPCEPATCADLGAECGLLPDGCGGVVDCGDPCVAPETCEGGGVASTCGCTPHVCVPDLDCGMMSDGCNGQINCVTPCKHPKVCNPQTKQCCMPAPCPDGDECVTIDDGCGLMKECGICGGW